MYRLKPRPRHPKRGVTLVEMLVVVALLVLMMTIIVQIFQSATGSVTAAKVYQELDDELRELDGTIRKDLQGATAHFNPPLDPDDNLGYFEYIENAWSDLQGEDSDDCLRFTVQAPPNQPFTGRMYIYSNPSTYAALFPNAGKNWLPYYLANQPITITSEYAEVIYFLRNGNLYRRVFLIAPERQAAVNLAIHAATGTPISSFTTGMIPGSFTTSWLGVNDLSARPSSPTVNVPSGPPILNTLGDLTNRENRAFAPRFGNDFDANGIPDDYNINLTSAATQANPYIGDGVPDFYPTLYPGVFNLLNTITGTPIINTAGFPNYPLTGAPTTAFMAFPYIFPGAYSQPDPLAVGTNIGWIHSLDPTGTTFNHAPLDLGPPVDSIATPSPTNSKQFQTWWGFPTWRETLSANWNDPVWQVYSNGFLGTAKQGQATGLIPFAPNNTIVTTGLSGQNLLPDAGHWFNPPPFNDAVQGYGSSSSFLNTSAVSAPAIWDDDLIMTGVRSFDVKAYDNSTSTYVDLGNSPVNQASPLTNPNVLLLAGQNLTTAGFTGLSQSLSMVPTSLAHEGMIPPRVADYRLDPQAQAKGILIPLGDDQKSTIRLRRTYDTWSTAYSEAPATGYDCSTNAYPPFGMGYYPPSTLLNLGGSGTVVVSNPVYPSYPAPYPAPLRGIQIQVRVVDPRSERIKVLTIRQDFSDKIDTSL